MAAQLCHVTLPNGVTELLGVSASEATGINGKITFTPVLHDVVGTGGGLGVPDQVETFVKDGQWVDKAGNPGAWFVRPDSTDATFVYSAKVDLGYRTGGGNAVRAFHIAVPAAGTAVLDEIRAQPGPPHTWITKGDTGPAPQIDNGTIATGAPGSAVALTFTETAPGVYEANGSLPQGQPGAPGGSDSATASWVTTGPLTTSALSAKYTNRKGRAVVDVTDPAYGAKGDGVTDDRPAIQAALDAAGIGGTIYFPPSASYLLATATLPADRILKTYKDQTILGAGRFASTLKVAASFGDYACVIGLSNSSAYCGRWSMRDIGIDQNASNGNALKLPIGGTTARNAVLVGSYAVGSAVDVSNCAFSDGDTVNTLYLYADSINVSYNSFLGQGGPVGTAQHDHSTTYTTTTVVGGTQTIAGNTYRGVAGSGGATTAIETHGGAQTITNNAVSDFATGANLTGVASVVTDGMVFNSNVITGVTFGVQVWSYYTTGVTTGVVTSGTIITNNAITVNRDAWSAVLGANNYGTGVLLAPLSDGPMASLNVSNNTITFRPSATAPTGDYKSAGIKIESSSMPLISELRIADNTITAPYSTGVYVNCKVKRGKLTGNTVVDPGTSTDSGLAAAYKSGIVLVGALEDVDVDGNKMVDTRAPHVAAYNVICLAPLTAVGCNARGNSTRFVDGANPLASFIPVSSAGAEFFYEESQAVFNAPFYPTKVGSRITATGTGSVYVQTAAPSGTAWKKSSVAQGATVSTSAPAAGAGGALPATPAGYVTLNINGTDRQVPYY